MTPPPELEAQPAIRPTGLDQLRAWIAVGTQSVGGGPSSLLLIRRIMVMRRSWLTLPEFMQDWTLSRLSLGNHLTALAALIGLRIGGPRGVPLAVLGLLVPSGVITAALTGGFAAIRDQPAVQAALAGVAPVTIGMMFGMSTILLRSIVSRRPPALVVDLAMIGTAIAAGFLLAGYTMAIILAGALIGVLALGRDEPLPEGAEE